MKDNNKSKILIENKKTGAGYDTNCMSNNNNLYYMSKPQNFEKFNSKPLGGNKIKN